jgi:mersacidin/lichenicidin family type 2 lantibiotic
MSSVDIIRAWKDEEYRLGLTEAQRALLPAHPAGLIELDDEQMKTIVGGHTGGSSCNNPRCTCLPA